MSNGKGIRDGKPKPPFANGTWVWVLKPPAVGGNKVERCWKGPYQIAERVGDQSYRVTTDKGTVTDVHRDQLKPCVWDVELGESYPLVFRKSDPTAQLGASTVVDEVLGHRKHPQRGLEFLTHWTGAHEEARAWESAASFLQGCPEPWLQYCSDVGIHLDLHKVMESRGQPGDALKGVDMNKGER